jgi:hypothetical protein
MKSRMVLLLLFSWPGVYAAAQEARLLDSLRTAAQAEGPSRHFAGLYYSLTEKIRPYTQQLPEATRNFINRFSENFLRFFLEAHRCHQAGNPIPANWQRYYQQHDHPLHNQFTGMNAHINGDMWQALRQTGPADTIRKYRTALIRLQPVFRRFYDSIFTLALREKRVRTLHGLTLGLGRSYGRSRIARWRKRQVDLACWHDHKPRRFQRKWASVRRRMSRMDALADKWLR